MELKDQTRSLEGFVTTLTALAQETRLAVFRELAQAHSSPPHSGGLAAGNLAARLGVAASTLSFHLKEMHRAGLVDSRKQGRSIIYTANFERMEALLNYLTEDCCGGTRTPAATNRRTR